jgi:hypothetical protein
MAKSFRHLPARAPRSRLTVETLEDRSLPSWSAGGGWFAPPPAGGHDGPFGTMSGPTFWRAAAFAPRPAPDGDRFAAGGWADPDGGPGAFGPPPPGAFGPGFGAYPPPDRGAPPDGPGSVTFVIIVTHDPPPTPALTPAPTPPPAAAGPEAHGADIRTTAFRPFARPGAVDQVIAVGGPNLAPTVTTDAPGLTAVVRADRPLLTGGSGAVEAAPVGGPAWQLATAAVRGGSTTESLDSPGGMATDGVPADKGSAAEPGSRAAETPTSTTPAAPLATAWPAHVGLIPLDPKAWEQGARQFFERLGLLGRDGEDDASVSRLAPWLVAGGALALGAEFARRRRAARAPAPADLPRRGLAWHWSDEFTTPPPADHP